MPRVATARVALEAQVHGAGPRVLLLGGTGADLRKAPSIFTTPLGERCEVMAFDAREINSGQRVVRAWTQTIADFVQSPVTTIIASKKYATGVRPICSTLVVSPASCTRVTRLS